MFLTCQTFGRIMLQQGNGRIVTIASMSGNHIVNRPQKQAAYNASKAAVTALSESLAAECAPRGIRVNALSPGYIATPMVQSKKDLFDTWVEQIPFGRMATPQETAAAVGFLLSDDAAYSSAASSLWTAATPSGDHLDQHRSLRLHPLA